MKLVYYALHKLLNFINGFFIYILHFYIPDAVKAAITGQASLSTTSLSWESQKPTGHCTIIEENVGCPSKRPRSRHLQNLKHLAMGTLRNPTESVHTWSSRSGMCVSIFGDLSLPVEPFIPDRPKGETRPRGTRGFRRAQGKERFAYRTHLFIRRNCK